MPTLASFETQPLTAEAEREITDFVKCKVESVMMQVLPVVRSADGAESSNFKAAVHKFRQVFAMPAEEKLVNCECVIELCWPLLPLLTPCLTAQTTRAATGRTTCLAKAGCTSA